MEAVVTVEGLVDMTPSWNGRRVMVTGATGLLGSNLVSELVERDAEVIAVVRDDVPASALWNGVTARRVNVVHGDVCDADLMLRTLNEYEIGVVYHLAAQTIVSIANRHPLSTFESNVRGTYLLLDACRIYGAADAIVVASSDKAYGDHDELPYTESAPLIGRHPYDVSKSCADLISQSYAISFGLPVCVTRCGNLFGPGDLNFNRIIPSTIRSVLRGQPPVLRSDGSMVRDYFYVRDGSLAYLRLAEKMMSTGLSGEAFNFSNEVQLTVLEIVERILALMGSDLKPVILGSATGEIKHQYLSAEKARRLLQWAPSYDLVTGLTETVAWYTQHLMADAR
jgi:CDP-glucose 4,6-dehydratase